MTTIWNRTRGGLEYADHGGRYITKAKYRLDVSYVAGSDLIEQIQSHLPKFIGEPVVEPDYAWSDCPDTVLAGERYCTDDEVTKITAHLAAVKKQNALTKEKKEAADRREFERLSKKFAK